ncbi:negative regulator of sigma-B (phosphoserine phosphatase) [Rhizomicrobium palustre]|uniref:Negative regulator of sigma-B (Phosphoserine phosphatase) n=1 Tax=Rhizomicrobium palustre TaxID=189966 RepID=A0A846N0B5_9PROT|nr:SpoIIE family protein phosphatase [Rhizomicrobium palustre]NIK88939.1 negative regulator of sigma-B (phosphoserine phosphatase) [Rhizomicrobium palustre]
MPAQALQPLEIGAAARTLAGEKESGDRFVVLPSRHGTVVSVVDGLGHGPAAAFAGKLAVHAISKHVDDILPVQVERCHQMLKKSRGAVMALAHLQPTAGQMSWLSIGNVAALRLRPTSRGQASVHSVLPRGGIIGHRVPARMQTLSETLDFQVGDLVLFATDGIAEVFYRDVDCQAPCQAIADSLLKRHSKETDDALVLVLRWNENPPTDPSASGPGQP